MYHIVWEVKCNKIIISKYDLACINTVWEAEIDIRPTLHNSYFILL